MVITRCLLNRTYLCLTRTIDLMRSYQPKSEHSNTSLTTSIADLIEGIETIPG